MTIIAVDPGVNKPQAYAVFVDGRLRAWGSSGIESLDEVFWNWPQPVWCIVEDQFARKAPDKAIQLAHVAGRIAEKAIRAGAKVHYLNPSEWQAPLCGSWKTKRSERRRRFMQHARNLAAKMGMSFEQIPEDEAAAICMGDYWVESGKAQAEC